MVCVVVFFFNDTATTEIYTLSLHDALPILGTSGGKYYLNEEAGCSYEADGSIRCGIDCDGGSFEMHSRPGKDRKSTRLNSSHANISYAVFCLKKKKKINYQ